MSVQPRTFFTLEQYLELEQSSREKHEFYAGEVFAMGGASERHNLIVGNLLAALHTRLRGKPCRVYPSDLRVKVSATGLYAYPDLVVVCGASQLEQPGETYLILRYWSRYCPNQAKPTIEGRNLNTTARLLP